MRKLLRALVAPLWPAVPKRKTRPSRSARIEILEPRQLLSAAASSQITEYQLPDNVVSIGTMVKGPDGNLWFTYQGGHYNSVADPTTDWSVAVYPPLLGGPTWDYVAESQLPNASLAGPFSVDFKYTGTGQPGAQSFSLYQYDANGNPVGSNAGLLSSGSTTLYSGAVPEPSSFWMSGLGLLAIGVRRAFRRGTRAAA